MVAKENDKETWNVQFLAVECFWDNVCLSAGWLLRMTISFNSTQHDEEQSRNKHTTEQSQGTSALCHSDTAGMQTSRSHPSAVVWQPNLCFSVDGRII